MGKEQILEDFEEKNKEKVMLKVSLNLTYRCLENQS